MCELLNSRASKKRTTAAAPSTAAPLFRLGSVYATPAALALMKKHGVAGASLLVRHQTGDFGQVGADSVRDNHRAIKQGDQIISAYRLLALDVLERMTVKEQRKSPTVWIVTGIDQAATTIMTMEDC